MQRFAGNDYLNCPEHMLNIKRPATAVYRLKAQAANPHLYASQISVCASVRKFMWGILTVKGSDSAFGRKPAFCI